MTGVAGQLKSDSFLHRSNLRGIKRCPSCGTFNGQRALICKNEDCELRKKRIPFDPVQLVDHAGSQLFSVRNKERDMQPRNFVQITEVTLSLQPEAATAIVSRNAICFVDTCKYDPSDVGIECKHIKACTLDASKSQLQMPQAEVFIISHDVLWNLNIEPKQKQRLWDMYKEGEQHIPAVQKLTSTLFAVKCEQSKVFPAGRLHVIASCNKKTTHSCACKKLKIIVEPDNSVVMQEEICDHILLLLAAILSRSNGRTVYKSFTEALEDLWLPLAVEPPLNNVPAEDDFALFGPNINIGGDFGHDQSRSDDIFIFGNDLLNDDIPDLSDIPTDLKPMDFSPFKKLPSISTTFGNTGSSFFQLDDPNLLSNCSTVEFSNNENDISFNDVTSTTSNLAPSNNMSSVATQLALSDCNIELMDQFQLTNQIDLCSDDIALPLDNSISILPNLGELNPAQPVVINAITTTTTPAILTATVPPLLDVTQGMNMGQAQAGNPSVALPPIELPTIAVEKNLPIKASQIVAKVNTRKFPHIPAKRSLIINSEGQPEAVSVAPGIEPALGYSAWLENIIETINDSVEIGEQTDVSHTFHVHEEIFAHFSKSFSVGIKRRMPNSSAVVKSGKHKGLIKYTWYFSRASTVRRIFTTKNLSLQDERVFECLSDGSYVPYVRKVNHTAALHVKGKRVYPKLSLHTAYIWFDCSNGNHKTGFKLEWLPNAFPKSHFGILNIAFSLGVRK